jgi:hypothetical protein
LSAFVGFFRAAKAKESQQKPTKADKSQPFFPTSDFGAAGGALRILCTIA